jgi:hypothetical protein
MRAGSGQGDVSHTAFGLASTTRRMRPDDLSDHQRARRRFDRDLAGRRETLREPAQALQLSRDPGLRHDPCGFGDRHLTKSPWTPSRCCAPPPLRRRHSRGGGRIATPAQTARPDAGAAPPPRRGHRRPTSDAHLALRAIPAQSRRRVRVIAAAEPHYAGPSTGVGMAITACSGTIVAKTVCRYSNK